MSPPARRSIARIHDVDLHWTEVGQGRPLVLLHGLTDSHLTWSRVSPQFAATHRVLAPDLAGHGLSGRPDASYALAWHAEVMGAWLDALGLDDIDLVGHSFGGGVAQWLVLTHAARIRRLGLVAAGGLGREVSLALRLCSLPGVVERLGQPFMRLGTRLGIAAAGCGYEPEELDTLSWMNDRPGSARALARTVRDVIDLGGQHRHFLDRAGEIEALPPIAVFWGDRDPVIPIEHG
ncbi:MAG: alpha/beta fold hydrolase, partial [Polyangiaceae bacterium]|nr:alpha/beta fold hydrolase [Polyangiaceae bacterium]